MNKEDTIADQNDLVLAATAIFGGTSNVVPLEDGRSVEIRPATMKTLPQIIAFFQAALDALDPETIGGIVEVFAERQQALIDAGKNPAEISMEDVGGISVVQNAFTKVHLLSSLLSAVLGVLPRLAPAFTNLTQEEFENLPPDRGMLVAGGIFMLNYHFFSQSLPPMLAAFMKSWASKKGISLPAKKTIKRRS